MYPIATYPYVSNSSSSTEPYSDSVSLSRTAGAGSPGSLAAAGVLMAANRSHAHGRRTLVSVVCKSYKTNVKSVVCESLMSTHRTAGER